MFKIISVFLLVVSTQVFAGDIYLICEDGRTSEFVVDVSIELDNGASTFVSFVDQYSADTRFDIEYRHDHRSMRITQKSDDQVLSTIVYAGVDFHQPVKVGLDYLCFIAD